MKPAGGRGVFIFEHFGKNKTSVQSPRGWDTSRGRSRRLGREKWEGRQAGRVGRGRIENGRRPQTNGGGILVSIEPSASTITKWSDAASAALLGVLRSGTVFSDYVSGIDAASLPEKKSHMHVADASGPDWDQVVVMVAQSKDLSHFAARLIDSAWWKVYRDEFQHLNAIYLKCDSSFDFKAFFVENLAPQKLPEC